MKLVFRSLFTWSRRFVFNLRVFKSGFRICGVFGKFLGKNRIRFFIVDGWFFDNVNEEVF